METQSKNAQVPVRQDGDIIQTAALHGSGRVALGVVSLTLGILAAWMFWIVHKFLNGKGWFDLIVGLVLGEFILAVGLFAAVLLVGAVFAPTCLSRALAFAYHKLTRTIALLGLLFGASLLILLLVVPVLVRLGVLE